MEDHLCVPDQLIETAFITNISLDDRGRWMEILPRSTREVIENRHSVVRYEGVRQMASDEPRPTGDEHVHGELAPSTNMYLLTSDIFVQKSVRKIRYWLGLVVQRTPEHRIRVTESAAVVQVNW